MSSNGGRVEVIALLLSMLLVSVVVAYAFFTAPEKPLELIVDKGVIPGTGGVVHVFSPCMGEVSPGVLFSVFAESSSPLAIEVIYPNGTVLLEAHGFTRGELWFVYPRGEECRPLRLVVHGEPGSSYHVVLSAKMRTSGMRGGESH